MASSVFYKFKAAREQSRITFDGTGISVFDLKRDIILANNLSKANDFDLAVSDASSGQEFNEDSAIIPRSSSIIVKRVPARQGRGRTAMYIAGVAGGSSTDSNSRHQGSSAGGFNNAPSWHKGAMSKRFDGKEDLPKTAPPALPQIIPGSIADDAEAAAMAAMFQAQSVNWEETQEKMTHQTRVAFAPRGGAAGSRGAAPGKPAVSHQQMQMNQQTDRPLPPSYVCYRCGQKGHWIQDCPTNNDREFDNRPRIKRTTGIPRSMLKTVDNPNSTGKFGPGVMVTPDGGYVVAQPDLAAWQKQVAKPKGLTAAEVRERAPTNLTLTCELDNQIFRDAVKTPCCGTSYCEECIQTLLLERDFVCPHCSKKIASLDKLVPDREMRAKVDEYIEKAIEQSMNEVGEGEVDASATASAQPTATDAAVPTDQQQQGQGPQDYYADPTGADMSQMIADSIPQLQAQLAQLSVMLQNSSLPSQVRQTTSMQHQQLQMQLQQAQAISAAMGMYGAQAFAGGGGGYPQQQQQQQQPQGPYDRLPVNNRGRKRPGEFGDDHESKVARYSNWEQ